jgi:putative ABC transport system permease protein
MKIVTKAFLRYLPRRRGLSLLQLMGIACGVAATIGMMFSARAALSGFTRAVAFLRGDATHAISRPAGPMGEEILARLMMDPAVAAFSPVIDRRVELSHGETVRLLGLDPFLDRAVRPLLIPSRPADGRPGSLQDALAFLLEEDAVLVEQGLFERLDQERRSLLESSHGPLRPMGTFSNPAGEPLILMDIGHAQARFGLDGLVDRVDLILSDPPGFLERWEQGFFIQSNQQQQTSLGDMLRAFRLNLEALSLLALFVGVFLVYNTAMFAVVSRRRDAGILRSLGASRREIVAAFLAEILLLGAAGGALGGGLGYLLSRFLTGVVGDTISMLYFHVRPTLPAWSGWVPVLGGLLGCGASLLGGALPLRELVRVDPVEAIRGRTASTGSTNRWRRAAWGGGAVLALSTVLCLAASLHVYVGFAGAFGLLLGSSLLTGGAMVLLGPVLGRALGLLGGVAGRVAAGNVSRNLGRTAVAVAAFMVALSMSVGLGTMIGSFRQTLIRWMDSQLQGDLYIAPSREVEVPESFLEELGNVPGIGGLDPYRNVQIPYQGRLVHVSAVNAGALQRFTRFGFLSGGNENWEAVKGGAVIVSESFSRRFGVRAGDRILIEGAAGPRPVDVAAVFYDYTSEHGLIMMDRAAYLAIFQDRTIDALVVFVDPDRPGREGVLAEVRARAGRRGLPVSDRRQFHGAILALFDATFAVTRSMRILAVIVAFFGIAGAILTLFMERRRDFGIYRALGFSTPQVAAMTLMEGMAMGLLSCLMSAAVGTALAWVLIGAINLQSFNWTIFFRFQWGPYLLAAGTALVASAGAAAYPIWKVCRTYPQMQIREE